MFEIISKRQSQTTVLLRTPVTQMIFFNRGRLFLLALYIVDKARYGWTGGSAVDVNIENERLTVVRSRCCKKFEMEILRCYLADHV